MSYYVDLDWQSFELVEETPEGNVDTGITVEIRPFEFVAYQEMVTIFQTAAGTDVNSLGEDEKKDAGIRLMGDPRFSKFLKERLPQHARNVVGLDVKIDGQRRQATVDDIVTYAAFMSFAMQIFNRISSASAMSKEDETDIKKN